MQTDRQRGKQGGRVTAHQQSLPVEGETGRTTGGENRITGKKDHMLYMQQLTSGASQLCFELWMTKSGMATGVPVGTR